MRAVDVRRSMRTPVISMRVRSASPSTSAFSIASTTFMPSATRPNTVYLPSRTGCGPSTTKKLVCALSGASPRAIETMPRSWRVSLNSGGRFFT